jgi:hypothetical protein
VTTSAPAGVNATGKTGGQRPDSNDGGERKLPRIDPPASVGARPDLYARDHRRTVEQQLDRIAFNHGVGADALAKLDALEWATSEQKHDAVKKFCAMTAHNSDVGWTSQ